jgi:hypothetical protein
MQIQSDVLNLAARPNDDRRTGWLDFLTRYSLKVFSGLVPVLCKWYAGYRSFRGHIRIQSSTSGGRIDLGPSVQSRDGRYRANMRTLARAEGIEKLRAIHPWVDIADLRIFLMGFESGEEYSNTHCLQQDSSSSHNTRM